MTEKLGELEQDSKVLGHHLSQLAKLETILSQVLPQTYRVRSPRLQPLEVEGRHAPRETVSAGI